MVWWVTLGRKAGRERKSRIFSLKCFILKANSMFYITIRIKAYCNGRSVFSMRCVSTDYLVLPSFLECLGL